MKYEGSQTKKLYLRKGSEWVQIPMPVCTKCGEQVTVTYFDRGIVCKCDKCGIQSSMYHHEFAEILGDKE